MANSYDVYNANKVKYAQAVVQVASSISVNQCIAFVKDGKKYILKIAAVRALPTVPDANILAMGVCIEGGIFSVDGITVDNINGKSAGGFDSSRSYLTLTDEEWNIEMTYASHFEIFTTTAPLVIQGIMQANSVKMSDDMWELIEMDSTDFTNIMKKLTTALHHGAFLWKSTQQS